MVRKASYVLIILSFCIASVSRGQSADSKQTGLKFSVTFDKTVNPSDISGRVYVMISTNDRRPPKDQVGMTGVPFWGMNVNELSPGAVQSDEIL